jgi:hypothetical protein
MSATVANGRAERHRVNGENTRVMLKADLPKREKRQLWPEIGACLDAARRDVGWTVDQLASFLDRDSKQVGRWLRGEEQTQVAAVFAVEALRWPFLVALARLAEAEITTEIRRRA